MHSPSLMEICVEKKKDHLSCLPTELKDIILGQLSMLGIIALSQTSKHYESLIDAWSPNYFDECACMPLDRIAPETMDTRGSRLCSTNPHGRLTFSANRLLAHRETGWPMSLNGESREAGHDSQTSSMFSNLDASAEYLIITAPIDSFTDEIVDLAMELGSFRKISAELAQHFTKIKYARTWNKTFPDDFLRLSKSQQGRHRCVKLLEILKCESDRTYEIIPSRLSARAFLIHLMHLRCTCCTSEDMVERFFHHRYCRACVRRLEKEQHWSPLLCASGVRHCFGNTVDARILESVNVRSAGPRSLVTYEAALKKDQDLHATHLRETDPCPALLKLQDLFRSCYVNANVVEGLFNLLLSHHKCQAVLKDTYASSKLDIATDYILAACARYSRIRDKYMHNHARPETELLRCSAVNVFVKYGPMTNPDNLREYRQTGPLPEEDFVINPTLSNIYRFSFWFAWACLTIQAKPRCELSSTVDNPHSDVRNTAMRHKRSPDHARHDQPME